MGRFYRDSLSIKILLITELLFHSLTHSLTFLLAAYFLTYLTDCTYSGYKNVKEVIQYGIRIILSPLNASFWASRGRKMGKIEGVPQKKKNK